MKVFNNQIKKVYVYNVERSSDFLVTLKLILKWNNYLT